ncbi:MAG: SDR family NAD(P)-dependent oxidoreductase [Chloroflexi bacterium]|nr:MAG: SDR family NAD(P)-dependent oxidoreductase [Chloroflexota bacterium]MBL1197351.1 SDR family oxidoreductase [Chloroflexota bacterium]NOH14648.1 SDR family oxidoreductase [Chloroflexota bacterium]
MQRIFITGANRGIGLELARQTLLRGDRVFAAARQPENAIDLQELKAIYGDQLTIVRLEVTNQAEIDTAVEQVRKEADGLDVLINNAGMLPPTDSLDSLEADTILKTLEVNSVAPLMISKAFMGLLQNGTEAKIVNISSQAGSLSARRVWEGRYSYSASKSALNMLSKTLAAEVEKDGISVVIIHPGWVSTDMGGSAAPVTPPESAAGILQVLDNLTLKDTARFFAWDGTEVPW